MRTCAMLLGLIGCDLNLPNEGTLDRTRILAARAEPAQPSANQPFTVTSYAWSPSGPPTVVWCSPLTTCDPRDPLVSELAALDWEALPATEQTAWRTAALEVGVLGVEPGLPPLATAPPPDAGDQVVLLAFGVPPEGDDIEEATLTLEVAGDVPNQHPTITEALLDGVSVSDVVLERDRSALLEVVVDGLETYADGDQELEEAADVRWYTDAPEVESAGPAGGGPEFLDDGTFDVVVDQAFEGVVVAVVRDGRGGADWIELSLRVE